jgi:4-amino-4-deoxy-L-arabinose transferase-like glycosyltransferase
LADRASFRASLCAGVHHRKGVRHVVLRRRWPQARPFFLMKRAVERLSDHGVVDILGRAAHSHVGAIAILVVVSLACFLPGIGTIPAIDRDEARYVQATTQMLETRDFVDIRLHDKPRYIQPVGIYWLQAAAVRLVGASVPAPVWVHRLPSLLGACAIVLLTYWCGLAFGDRRTALLAGVMMATALLPAVEAHLAKTDAVLNAAILACQGVLLRLYLRGREGAPGLWFTVLFWAAAGFGILVKGPILPMVVGLTVIGASALARDIVWLKPLRPAIGVPILLAIALPWYVAIGIATDGAFFTKAIGFNVIGKIATAQQSHGFPPGFYLAAVWITFWPAAAVVAAALPSAWRERDTKRIRFLAAWVLPSWIVFELTTTKLPHYVLPLYPALALTAAWGLTGGRIDTQRLWVRLLAGLAALGSAALAALGVIAFMKLGHGPIGGLVALAVIPVILSGVAAYLILAGSLVAGWLLTAVVAAPLAYTCVFAVVAPRLDALWVSPRLAAATGDVTGCAEPKVITVGYEEASLVFAVGTDIRFGDAGEAAAFLDGGPCRAAIVERAARPAFLAALHTAIPDGSVANVSGISIGNMRPVAFDVYGTRDDAAAEN